jgi:hypothetical protein
VPVTDACSAVTNGLHAAAASFMELPKRDRSLEPDNSCTYAIVLFVEARLKETLQGLRDSWREHWIGESKLITSF